MSDPQHLPVLLTEVCTLLQPERGGVFVDATVGLGGHAAGLLDRARAAGQPLTLYGIDQDPAALTLARERLASYPQVTLLPGNFRDLPKLAARNHIPPAQGILMDIGVSSLQLDDPERGFSFTHNGPLDMRMDPENTVSAATIVNTWPEVKLANLIYQYGEERRSRAIAKALVERRRKEPFWETADLATVITDCYPPRDRHKHPHPATRTFQALRIEVNEELMALEEGIEAALKLLAPSGILAIISFHSLEDRIVKWRFREASNQGYQILTKKPLTASVSEAAENPRSRSAKLRVIQRA